MIAPIDAGIVIKINRLIAKLGSDRIGNLLRVNSINDTTIPASKYAMNILKMKTGILY